MAGSVRDGFSKKVVGWDSGPRASSELVLSALDYALLSRDVRDGALIHHSDKGSVSTPRCGSPSDSSAPSKKTTPTATKSARR